MQTHTTHSHWLCRNTSCQSNCFQQQKKTRKKLNARDRASVQQSTHPYLNHEQINIEFTVTNEGKLFIWENLPQQFSLLSRKKICFASIITLPVKSKENICLWATKRKMIKRADTLLSLTVTIPAVTELPIGHEATRSSHTTSQPPLNHGNHITWPSPMTSNHWQAMPSANLNTTDFLVRLVDFKNSPIKLPEINKTTLQCEKAKMWPRRTETEELRGWNQLNSQPHRVSAGAELCKKEKKGAGSETFTFSFLRKRRIKKKQELARPPFSPKGKFFCYQMFTPQQEAEAAQQSEMGVYIYSIWGIAIIAAPSHPPTVQQYDFIKAFGCSASALLHV